MHFHILGICGSLMGSIALLAREMGHTVSGTDENVYPPMSDQLEQAGIALNSPYTETNLPDTADLIIVGNAGLPRGNLAVEKMLRGATPFVSGAEWLAKYLLADRWVIGVSGTHGKTTTSAMTAFILDKAGLAPGFLIGGVPLDFGQSSRLGAAPYFVIEADEYDTSYFDRRSKFLHYQPRTLIINNLEYDHADIFDSLEDIKGQFHLLMRTLPDDGLVIRPEGDANIDDVLARGCWTPTIATGGKAARAKLLVEDGSRFEVVIEGRTEGQVSWSLTGQHNVGNALAAILAARHAGVPPAAACEALCSFQGVKRRMEVL
ncbi:MAG: UDP-N-acetylmuramate:L-alanyl-gamma-D-glutamyl-meso-diaminopimelate ligase, partial [Pseudomonadales bacterium]